MANFIEIIGAPAHSRIMCAYHKQLFKKLAELEIDINLPNIVNSDNIRIADRDILLRSYGKELAIKALHDIESASHEDQKLILRRAYEHLMGAISAFSKLSEEK